jgi:Uma2 family endonuclease
LPSLKEYALIDPETRRVEVFRINTEGLFVLFDMSESDTLDLSSINCRIPVSEVFSGIDVSLG